MRKRDLNSLFGLRVNDLRKYNVNFKLTTYVCIVHFTTFKTYTFIYMLWVIGCSRTSNLTSLFDLIMYSPQNIASLSSSAYYKVNQYLIYQSLLRIQSTLSHEDEVSVSSSIQVLKEGHFCLSQEHFLCGTNQIRKISAYCWQS